MMIEIILGVLVGSAFLYWMFKNVKQEGKQVMTELMNKFETRPWGSFEVLLNEPNCKVKKLIVNPKQKLSLQFHNFRDEYWVVSKGIAYIQIHETKFDLNEGETLNIPRTIKHRIENRTDKILEIIETQLGEKVIEEDIVRIEDDFGRAHTNK